MVPLTFFNTLSEADNADARKALLDEFASHGVRHLVMTDAMVLKIMGKPSLYGALHAEMAAAGMDFVDSHAPFSEYSNLAIPDDTLRQVMIERQRLTLRLVHDFGVKTCTFHVGRLFYPSCTLEQYRRSVYQSLDALLPMAEELKVVVAVENIMRPLNTTDFLLELKSHYPTEWFGFCYDAGHANIMQTGREQAGSQPFGNWEGWGDIQWEQDVLAALRSNIVSCHLHDNTGFHDDHLLAGMGTVNWSNVINGLKQAPRLQSVQSEVIYDKHGYSLEKLCRTMSALTDGLAVS